MAIRESYLSENQFFKQLDTALVGMVDWVTTNSRKFSLRKSIFKQFAKFSPARETRYIYGIVYGIVVVSNLYDPAG